MGSFGVSRATLSSLWVARYTLYEIFRHVIYSGLSERGHMDTNCDMLRAFSHLVHMDFVGKPLPNA